MKRIVCDASSLISISENCMLRIIKRLSDKVCFVIPKAVKEEIIDHPLQTKHFAFKAMVIKHFMEMHGTITVYDDNPKIASISSHLLDLANTLFSYKGRNIPLLHSGEVQAVACLKLLGENTLLIDERTLRLLIENQEMLRRYLEERVKLKLHMSKDVSEQLKKELNGISVIRSSELIVYAYEKGLLAGLDSLKTLEAALYALKYSGCSITNDEIDEYIRLLK